MKHQFIALFCIAILLSSCAPAAPAPIPLPPTQTAAPATATPLPPTSTPEPAPEEMLGIIPVMDSWRDVPVMPGAISGMFELGDYFYTINAGEEEISAFYTTAMADLGWEAREDMTKKVPGTAFTYNKDGLFVFFLIEPDGENNRVLMHFVEE